MNQEHYAAAGVNVKQADHLVTWLKDQEEVTAKNCQIVEGLGAFAGAVRADVSGLEDPLFVASTDGIGTKVLLASEWDRLENLGSDVVAMCVNDLYTLGASPLFFMDYFATGALNANQFKRVLEGIRASLKSCNTILLGGETAEMPGLFNSKYFDIAGFVVGMVDRKKMLTSQKVQAGDALIGFSSSGFHSNGFSLIRKWLKDDHVSIEMQENLMRGTKVYSELNDFICNGSPHGIRALAHITGGGVTGNVKRMIPDGLKARIDLNSLETAGWMKDFILQHVSSLREVVDVFNLGVGMVAAVSEEFAEKVILESSSRGCRAFRIGHVEKVADSGDSRVEII